MHKERGRNSQEVSSQTQGILMKGYEINFQRENYMYCTYKASK